MKITNYLLIYLFFFITKMDKKKYAIYDILGKAKKLLGKDLYELFNCKTTVKSILHSREYDYIFGIIDDLTLNYIKNNKDNIYLIEYKINENIIINLDIIENYIKHIILCEFSKLVYIHSGALLFHYVINELNNINYELKKIAKIFIKIYKNKINDVEYELKQKSKLNIKLYTIDRYHIFYLGKILEKDIFFCLY